MKTDLNGTLQQQLRIGFQRLRFAPELEREFRAYQTNTVLVQRLLLLLIGGIMVACMPFFDAFLLHPPEAFVPEARLVQFGVILPSILLAFAFTADARLRRWSNPVGLAALCAVIVGWLYQRHLGAQYGYEVPALLIAVILSGVLSLSGLLFWTVAPVAALGMLLFAVSEIWNYGLDQASGFRILALFMLALVTALAGYLQEAQARSLWLQRKSLSELARHDPLTGLLNHRAFQEAWRQLFNVAVREQRPLLVAAVDIDYFKDYNDHAGHLQGDECLRTLAEALARCAQRGSDLVARTGGEEFMIVWYDVAADLARERLECARRRIEALSIINPGRPNGTPPVVTASVGGVWIVPDAQTRAQALLAAADARLYQSKREGRNRATLAMGAEALRESPLRAVGTPAAAA